MSEPHVVIIGNVNVDIVMGPQEPWPAAGTEVVLPDYELRVGGSAGNTALALQAIGVPIKLLANAGNDTLGRWLKDSFGEAASHWRLAECPTTVSVGITHPTGERTFFTNVGHLDLLDADDVLPFLPRQAPVGSFALLVGTFLSPRLVAVFPDILGALEAAGYRSALDTGWPPLGWTNRVLEHFGDWLGAIDALLVNEAEALALGRTESLDDAVENIRRMLRPGALLVVKCGPNGASAWRGVESASAHAPTIEVADSIGAGDVFNAALLKAEMRGTALQDALQEAVAFASAVIATRPRSYNAGSPANSAVYSCVDAPVNASRS